MGGVTNREISSHQTGRSVRLDTLVRLRWLAVIGQATAVLLGAFAIACATVLMFLHYSLPWDSEPPLELPPVYVTGIWFSILLAIAFIGLHAWQVTEDSRQLADALAATELVLAREQHLSQ